MSIIYGKRKNCFPLAINYAFRLIDTMACSVFVGLTKIGYDKYNNLKIIY